MDGDLELIVEKVNVIKFKFMDHEGAKNVGVPAYQTDGAAGFDLQAATIEPVRIPHGTWLVIPCGIAVEIPGGWHGAVRGRSGLAVKAGMSIVHGVGTIDSDYRGELFVPLYNHSGMAYTVRPGDRIAQLVLIHSPRFEVVEVDELSVTVRGEGGTGSTGR